MNEIKDVILTIIYLIYISIYAYLAWKFFLYNSTLKNKYGSKFFFLGKIQNEFLNENEKYKYRKLGKDWILFMFGGFLAVGIISFILHHF